MFCQFNHIAKLVFSVISPTVCIGKFGVCRGKIEICRVEFKRQALNELLLSISIFFLFLRSVQGVGNAA